MTVADATRLRLQKYRRSGAGKPIPSEPIVNALLVLVLSHGEAMIAAGDPMAVNQALDALEAAEAGVAG